MASSKKNAHEQLDESLIQLRDRTLAEDETVVAQAQGDHGQAVVLTSKRVLVLKSGITATGKIDGVVVGKFPFASVASVKVRKGPLGAVIQICPAVPDLVGQDDVPNNVVVFTGPQRVKKCEWIAARIESALGKPLERTEAPEDEDAKRVIPMLEEPDSSANEESAGWEDLTAQNERSVQSLDESIAEAAPASELQHPDDEAVPDVQTSSVDGRPRPNLRPPRSLADEIYAEVLEARTASSSAAEREITDQGVADNSQKDVEAEEPANSKREHLLSSASAAIADDTTVNPAEQVSQQPEPQNVTSNISSNPKLPKPVRRRAQRDKALTLLVLLFVALIAGIAAIAPSRYGAVTRPRTPAQESADQDVQLLHKHLQKISEYKQSVSVCVAKAIEYLQTVESAARSGDRSALVSLAEQPRLDELVRRVESTDAPIGLAAAKGQILAGLALARTVTGKLSVALQSSGGSDIRGSLLELGEARSKLTRGLAAIDEVRSEIERRSSESVRTGIGPGRSTKFPVAEKSAVRNR